MRVRATWGWLIVVPTAVQWLVSLGDWFVGDDIAWLAQAKRSSSPLPLLTNPWDGYFRPTFHLSLWAQWRCFGTRAMHYRLVSTGLHVLAGVLLARLVRGLGGGKWVARGSALAFFSLGMGAEAHLWISAQTVLLATTLSLASCLAWAKADGKSWRWGVVALTLFVLGLGASFTAFPTVLLLAFFTRRTRGWVVLALLFLAAAAFASTQVRMAPAVSREVFGRLWDPGWILMALRSWADAGARVCSPLPWTVGAVTFLCASLLLRPASAHICLHALGVAFLVPSVLAAGRHKGMEAVVPFDRYFYPARPVVAVLVAATAHRLWSCRGRWRRVALLLAALAWGAEQAREVRHLDVVLGAPSRRLRDTIEEIRALDPGPPHSLSTAELAVPDCWLTPSVATLFFAGRLTCGPARPGDVRLWRDQTGRLQASLVTSP